MTDPTAVPPKEPFAYLSDQNATIPKIREPILEILFAVFFAVMGVVCLVITAVHQHQGKGGLGAGIFVFILFAGFGVVVSYIGVRRLRWKRAYQRMMGHSPW